MLQLSYQPWIFKSWDWALSKWLPEEEPGEALPSSLPGPFSGTSCYSAPDTVAVVEALLALPCALIPHFIVSWIFQQNLILASFLDNYLPWICFFLSISLSLAQYFIDSQCFSWRESTQLYRLIRQNHTQSSQASTLSREIQLWNSQAWSIPISLNSSKHSEMLSTALEIQFHTPSSFSI